jgi:hypothetical protein
LAAVGVQSPISPANWRVSTLGNCLQTAFKDVNINLLVTIFQNPLLELRPFGVCLGLAALEILRN